MIHIVIVDDHQMFLDGMISVLSKQTGFNILFVENNAKSALEKLKNVVPDIVITDISMPEMNGIEFIRIIKKKYPEIKILAVSMFANLQSFENMDGYLLKETNKEHLIEAINKIVIDNGKYFMDQNNHADTFEFKKAILTRREKQIIELISQEYTTEGLADHLDISVGTVETHRKNIFLKLQVKNIAGLIKKAIHLGIVK